MPHQGEWGLLRVFSSYYIISVLFGDSSSQVHENPFRLADSYLRIFWFVIAASRCRLFFDLRPDSSSGPARVNFQIEKYEVTSRICTPGRFCTVMSTAFLGRSLCSDETCIMWLPACVRVSHASYRWWFDGETRNWSCAAPD